MICKLFNGLARRFAHNSVLLYITIIHKLTVGLEATKPIRAVSCGIVKYQTVDI